MMVAIAYSDKSRDYTLPQSGVFAMQQSFWSVPTAAMVWQNTLAVPLFPGSEYAGDGSVQADHLFLRVPAHFLVNHMDPPLFQRMPQRPLLLGHTTQINPSAPSVKRSSVCTLLKCAIW